MADPIPKPCLFCTLQGERIVGTNDLATAIRDAYPVSPGHTLIIPKRHVISFFDTTTEERLAMFELLDKVKRELDRGWESGAQPAADRLPPLRAARGRVGEGAAAYNIGINDGALAGQTIMHLHVHLIPRYAGDDSDPRGGIRKIFPAKAKYWK